MDTYTEKHLRGLYGLDSDVPHPALGFPRLPPLALARLGVPQGVLGVYDDRLAVNKTARDRLDMFQEDYRRMAAGLLDGQASVQRGHPLYGGAKAMSALRAENSKLRAENQNLRQQLDEHDTKSGDQTVAAGAIQS